VPLLLLSGCTSKSATVDPAPTPSIDGIQYFTDLSQRHLTKGEYDITYPQSPPVGGAHSPLWLKCQVYTQELPKVNVVHSLEHGGVWITYLPSTSPATVTQLDQYQGLNKEYVIVSPYAGQDSPIILTAWGAQLRLSSPTDPRIQEFVKAFAGNGPEKPITCASSGYSLDQAREYDAQQQ
jgi:hypothetical protein